ncbi:MAG: hypothetical protein KAJ37_00155 [Candidatus Krumholzibacteria bacterium]|nr:hypothetical protein [Candidatus Krumholzibacteria bacterium]
MKRLAEMLIGELAAYISSHLRGLGIDVILSGGSCVSIYSAGKYVSQYLDFIDTRFATAREVREAMLEIEFAPENRYFKHPHVDLLVEFPSGPPAVGKEPIGAINEIEFSTGVLRLLSPTDCVKDRLAAYYHWDDLQSLEQAVLVAQSNKIDMSEVMRWSKEEGMADAFERIAVRFP